MKQQQYKTIQTQSKFFLFTLLPKRYKVEADLRANTQPGTVTLQRKKAIPNEIKACKKPFSLIELIVAMVLFVFLMLIIVTMVTSTQETFSASVDRDNIYSNVSMVFELMTRDLQSSLYEDDKISFWQEADDKLNVISIGNGSKICEIRYKLDPPTGNIFTIQRSAVDQDLHSWNFYTKQLSSAGAMCAGDFQDIMDNVTELQFTCFGKDGIEIPPSASSDTAYPYSVKIDISCLSNKAALLYNENNNNEYKKQNERKFSRTVYLGNRE